MRKLWIRTLISKEVLISMLNTSGMVAFRRSIKLYVLTLLTESIFVKLIEIMHN